ncbi:ABC transporter permease [uncultured Eubacterium sp.]|uniref:ABC transporter permease n=1 Tax=uncultured Eubacterium sp. TaxID=165185 RepID=UPI0025992526|nr:ABC transporter permease [uncultured Eubacterium sp.]
MKLLLQLELSKLNSKRYIVIPLFITVIMCYFTTVLLFGLEDEKAINYSKYIWMSTAAIIDCYMLYAAVLVKKVIIDEYSKKTILTLFTYSISRYKLMVAKIVLILILTILSALITQIICIDFLVLVEPHLKLSLNAFSKADFSKWLVQFGWSIVIIFCFTLLIISIGFIKKSSHAVWTWVLVSIFVVQIIMSQNMQELTPFIGAATLILIDTAIRKYSYQVD